LFVGGVFLAESAFYSVVPPLLPTLVVQTHMTTAEAGVLVGAYPAGVMMAALPAIALVDRQGVLAAPCRPVPGNLLVAQTSHRF
jgi:predicted MFS family arabinose efflux permease